MRLGGSTVGSATPAAERAIVRYGLLDGAPDADLVLCAHTGLEGLTTQKYVVLGHGEIRA